MLGGSSRGLPPDRPLASRPTTSTGAGRADGRWPRLERSSGPQCQATALRRQRPSGAWASGWARPRRATSTWSAGRGRPAASARSGDSRRSGASTWTR
eukprot:2374842-Pyramimonas_sp.AAC.2